MHKYKLFEQTFDPKPSIIAERFRFHRRRDQHANESVSTYVAELRKLSMQYSTWDTLEDTLRDRLVHWINNENEQGKLLAKQT